MKLKHIFTILIATLSFNSFAQFYNGHQMNFGKNRVQYSEFVWYYYRYDRFDTYFYYEGKDIAYYTAKKIKEFLPEIERFFGYTLEKRIIFLLYNKLSDFRQSNIGLETENAEGNVGGATQIINNKVFLFYEKDHREFDIQIKEAIAKVVLSEMLFGGKFKDKVANSTLISVPEWFEKGLIAYAARDWNYEIENKIKDGLLSKKYKKFNQLRGDDAKYAGYSIWNYVKLMYGADAIPSIIYVTRYNKNPDSGFMQVLNASIKQLTPEWRKFYLDKFSLNNIENDVPNTKKIKKRPKKNTKYYNVKLSPKGDRLIYVTNIMGKYKIFMHDIKRNKTKKIIRKEHKIEQITDYSYPVIGWHPSGKYFVYIIEEKGQLYMYQYYPDKKETKKRLLPYFDKVLDFSFSDDGLEMAMSVVIRGLTDIVVFNTASGTHNRITHDLADDINPCFIENSSKIVFSSNRPNDTLRIEKIGEYRFPEKNYDLFVYNYKSKSNILTRITNTPYDDELNPYGQKEKTYIYRSDKNGIMNRHIATYDSVISYIDTTTHYRYFTSNYPLTNYNRNIETYSISKLSNTVAESFLYSDRYSIYKTNLVTDKDLLDFELKTSYFKNRKLKQQRRKDSLYLIRLKREKQEKARIDSMIANPPENLLHPDSALIDINNYIFEREKNIAYQHHFHGDILEKEKRKKDSFALPQQNIYLTTFYTDNMVSQVDFGNLSQSYQNFTGGPFYFNPGMNVFFKLGVNDLFDDYRIIGAMRLAGNLDSYEYLFSVENLKKQIDKQYVYHRKTFKNIGEYNIVKVITNEAMFIMKYPFNQVMGLKASFSMRYDRALELSTTMQQLESPIAYQAFASAKLEYIFDNSYNLGLNLYEGIKWKAWGEFYQQVEGNYDYIGVLGTDFRFYHNIHRNLIFATRFGTSTSFGSGKIIYYLGGVDNWTSLSPNANIFDRSIQIDQNENYIYQAVATNMRGFIQNARNGNTFALINNELRFPVFRYLANRPINSDFLNNFQVVGFFDVGSAWTGILPFSDNNAYNKYVIDNESVVVTVDLDRPTVVAGYGFGLRTRLFGYFLRLDWAWGIEGKVIMPRVFYFSLNLDF